MAKIYRSGDLRGEKLTDGVETWYCIWYPMPNYAGDDSEDSGICFDFNDHDLPDLTALIAELKDAAADTMDEEDG